MATPTMVTVNGALSPLLQATSVDFEVMDPVRYSVGPDVLLAHTLTATVAPDGTFSKPVYGTDDPAWSPIGWQYKVTIRGDNYFEPFYTQVPYGSSPVNFSMLLPTLAPADAALYAPIAHTHPGLASDVLLLLTTGEEVVPRGEVRSGPLSLTAGRMYLTDFVARKTETIASIYTATGGTAGVGGTHCRILVYDLTSGAYVKVAECSDDPTRWSATFANYNSPLLSPWSKVAGKHYAVAALWSGSGQAPALPASDVWYETSLRAPRFCSYIDLSGPDYVPLDPLNPAFTGPSDKRFQFILQP